MHMSVLAPKSESSQPPKPPRQTSSARATGKLFFINTAIKTARLDIRATCGYQSNYPTSPNK